MNKELRERIGDLAYEVTQNAATERPFTGEYDNFFERGIYVDVVSGEPLFASTDKFNLSTTTGTLTEKVWKGNANEVVFTVGGNTQLNKIVINGEDITPETPSRFPQTPSLPS